MNNYDFPTVICELTTCVDSLIETHIPNSINSGNYDDSFNLISATERLIGSMSILFNKDDMLMIKQLEDRMIEIHHELTNKMLERNHDIVYTSDDSDEIIKNKSKEFMMNHVNESIQVHHDYMLIKVNSDFSVSGVTMDERDSVIHKWETIDEFLDEYKIKDIQYMSKTAT